MKTFSLTETQFVEMLKKAFVAGYESPIEMMESEIAVIYNESLAELNTSDSDMKQPYSRQPPYSVFDTSFVVEEAMQKLVKSNNRNHRNR